MKKLFLFFALLFNLNLFSIKVATSNEYIIIARDKIAKVYSVKKIESSSDPLYNSYPIHKLDHGEVIKAIYITSNEKYAITLGDQYVYLWLLSSGRIIARL